MTDLPDGWHSETIAELTRGGVFSDGDWIESKDQDPRGSVRLTQLADVGVGTFRNRSDRWLREDQAARIGCTFLDPGDVLVARMPDPIGRACQVPEGLGRAVTAVDVAILRPVRDDVDPRYLMWAINSPEVHSRIAALQSGTTRKRVSRKNLATVEVPIPSLTEQQQIVETLEDHISRIDSAVSNLILAMRRIRRARESALDRIATPGVRARPLAEFAALVRGVSYSRSDVLLTSDSSGIPILRATDFSDGAWNSGAERVVVDASRVNPEQHLREGDILVATSSGSLSAIGKSALVSEANGEAFGAFCTVVRPRSIDPAFLAYCLRRPTVRRAWARSAAGTNINNLKRDALLSTPIPELHPNAQSEIVTRLSSMEYQLQTLERALSEQASRGNSLKRSLLRAAFRGELSCESATSRIIEVTNV